MWHSSFHTPAEEAALQSQLLDILHLLNTFKSKHLYYSRKSGCLTVQYLFPKRKRFDLAIYLQGKSNVRVCSVMSNSSQPQGL